MDSLPSHYLIVHNVPRAGSLKRSTRVAAYEVRAKLIRSGFDARIIEVYPNGEKRYAA